MEKTLVMRICASVLIVCYTTANISSNKWIPDHDFENNLDISQLQWDKDGISLLTCCSLCNLSPSSRSFFYHPSLNKCLCSRSYKRGLPAGQSMQQEWKYYTKAGRCDGDYAFNKTLGLCYKIHPEARNFSEAMNVCEAEGAKLIIIRNEMEFSHVQNAVKDAAANPYRPFIGLRKISFNETITWKWWNGQEASYLNWGDKEPNNQNGHEYCVNFMASEEYQYKYNDESCGTLVSFICQKYI